MLPRLYLVTDRTQTRDRPLVDVVRAAVAGGAGLVQLREKDLTAGELFALAVAIRNAGLPAAARLLINDRIDVVLAAGAAGVHLPSTSFSPADARRLLGADRLIGVSTHSVDAARAAAAAGADFVVFGPVFDTPSKRRYGAPLGVEALGHAAAAVTVPVYAIGGMTVERVAAIRGAGAYGVAAIAALLGAPDPTSAAQAFDAALRASSP